jgi:hypothetical protein
MALLESKLAAGSGAIGGSDLGDGNSGTEGLFAASY